MSDEEVAISIPAPVVEFLQESEVSFVVETLERAKVRKRGRGWEWIATETLDTHWDLLDYCAVLCASGADNEARERRGYRTYEKRIEQAERQMESKGDKGNG